MDNYKLTLGIKSNDKYQTAKDDLKKAMCSVGKLSKKEQRALAEELFGAARVAVVLDVFSKYLR